MSGLEMCRQWFPHQLSPAHTAPLETSSLGTPQRHSGYTASQTDCHSLGKILAVSFFYSAQGSPSRVNGLELVVTSQYCLLIGQWAVLMAVSSRARVGDCGVTAWIWGIPFISGPWVARFPAS